MSTDAIMNVVAVAGALLVLLSAPLLLAIPEIIEQYVAKRRAPKPVKITFRIGPGPPSPAEWAAHKRAEEIKYGQHQPHQ